MRTTGPCEQVPARPLTICFRPVLSYRSRHIQPVLPLPVAQSTVLFLSSTPPLPLPPGRAGPTRPSTPPTTAPPVPPPDTPHRPAATLTPWHSGALLYARTRRTPGFLVSGVALSVNQVLSKSGRTGRSRAAAAHRIQMSHSIYTFYVL